MNFNLGLEHLVWLYTECVIMAPAETADAIGSAADRLVLAVVIPIICKLALLAPASIPLQNVTV
jgi:hypothetical protein